MPRCFQIGIHIKFQVILSCVILSFGWLPGILLIFPKLGSSSSPSWLSLDWTPNKLVHLESSVGFTSDAQLPATGFSIHMVKLIFFTSGLSANLSSSALLKLGLSIGWPLKETSSLWTLELFVSYHFVCCIYSDVHQIKAYANIRCKHLASFSFCTLPFSI